MGSYEYKVAVSLRDLMYVPGDLPCNTPYPSPPPPPWGGAGDGELCPLVETGAFVLLGSDL